MKIFWLVHFCQLYFLTIDGFYLYNRFSKPLISLTSSATDSNSYPHDQVPRSSTPSRHDVCKVLISGMIGTDPKERYLSNGHYVLSFSVRKRNIFSYLYIYSYKLYHYINDKLAIVGHFKPIHEWEKFKHTETMWMNCETWDELAKSNSIEVRKGKYIRGIGYLVLNKWIDKTSGEEKKMNKLRLTKLLTKDEFDSIEMIMNDIDDSNNMNNIQYDMDSSSTDSGFSNEFPPLDNQVQQYNINTNNMNTNNNTINNKPWKKSNLNTTPVNSNVNNNDRNNQYKSNNKNNIPESKNTSENKISSNKKTNIIPATDDNWISWGNEDENSNANVDSMPWWE